MATIEVQGYVNRPQAKTSKGGKPYVQFGLGVKQKDKPMGGGEPTVTWANFQVTDFNNGSPLPEKTYVRVTGYLKVRDYTTKDGRKGQSLDIVAKEVINMSDNAQAPATEPNVSATTEKDPWE